VTTEIFMADQPLVVLIEPKEAQHRHAEAVARAGFRVASVAAEHVDVARVLEQGPAVVAAELDGSGSVPTLDLARRFRQNPQARLIPFVIYGVQLRTQDIENAARAGALWVQLEPADGARLAAAIRGLVAASREDDAKPRGSKADNRTDR
jgi:CheY-like chemotaxis protein